MKKTVSAILLMVTLLLCLASCGLSKKDVVGTWRGEWVYNGNEIVSLLELKEDGTYVDKTYRISGLSYKLSSTESGTYSIKGKEIICKSNDFDGHSTSYNYIDGQLENGNHYYTRLAED